MNLKLFPFSRKYIQNLLVIENLCFPDPWTETMMLEEIDEPYSYVLIIDEELIGYISGRLIEGEAHLFSIAINPSIQRKGLGSKLIKEWIEIVKRSGAKRVFLEVRESNKKAIEFYKKLKFSFDGIRKNYYENPTENAILFSLEI